MSEVLISGWRFKALLLVGLASVAGYLLAFAIGGWAPVWAALGGVSASGLAVLLGLSIANIGLRFLRWHLYLRALGHRVPWLVNLRMYLAGFALTLTPGNAGEAVRTVFLKRHGVHYTDGLAAQLSERLSDLAALLLLAAVGLSQFPRLRPALLVAAAALGLALALLAQGHWLQRYADGASTRPGRRWTLLRHASRLIEQARRCHSLPLLPLALTLGVLAWTTEALVLYRILQQIGQAVTVQTAIFAEASAILAGALTIVPGGVGGTEATLVALLALSGVAAPQALASTALFRLATLWFTVGIGLMALAASRRATQRP